MAHKSLMINNEKVSLELWDTAGQERYAKLVPVYFRNAHCIIIVFDLTNAESFLIAQKWVRDAREQYNEMIPVLIGNKSDLPTKAINPG